jgi:NADH:ubiquinone reductase (H+-translocating)
LTGEGPRVVILGGGFGGLYAAKALCGAPVRVTLVDRRNHHLFQPLLYQVATAAISPGDIAQPLRHVLRHCGNASVLLAQADAVEPDARRVRLRDGELAYDYLIVATGATHSYPGHPEWAALAPGLKTLEDAIEIRGRFLAAFEKAEREPDPARRRALLTFVIVGAGPTGVELAGAMAYMAKRLLPPEFRNITADSARILLLEGAPRVLPLYPEALSASAARQLARLGVDVRTGALLKVLEKGALRVGEERVESENVFWAAGVAASRLGTTLGAPLDRYGRVEVEPDLSLPGRREIFVAGDLARVKSDGRDVPGVAPAAIQMGRHAAAMILGDLRGLARSSFSYRDKGGLAAIGPGAAVADIRGWRFSGRPAWLAWLLVHIVFLIGFRNRLFVLLQWAWSYLGFQPSARLITYYGDDAPPSDQSKGRTLFP